MTILLTVETAVLVVLCILVAGLLRSYATVLQRLHQLDTGQATGTSAPPFRTAPGVVAPAGPADRVPAQSGRGQSGLAKSRRGKVAEPEFGPAHDISGTGLTGEVISIGVRERQADTVLVFLSSGCSGCTGFWDDLAHRREGSLVGDGRLVVVTKGAESESPGELAEMCPPGIDLVMSGAAWEDYAVPGSPYVVVVDGASGRVRGEGSGTSLTQISGLVHRSGTPSGGPGVKPRADADREVDVDRVLLSAGIAPGHPSLYSTVDSDEASRAPAEAHFLGLPERSA